MQNARLDEAQAGTKIAGRDSSNLRYVDDTTFIAEMKNLEPLDETREWKSKVKTQHSEN